MLYPLTFKSIFKERIWGGRRIQEFFNKSLPANCAIGESWEISDRPGDVSVIANGPLAGTDLRWLMENCREPLMGRARSSGERFPLLVKILDAQDKLSLQVHPPARVATSLGGEPKTEVWFVVDAAPTAELYLGLKRGSTKSEFERRLKDGSVEECFHKVAVQSGDSIFVPSGRVHALGAGNLIFEIQQNSDTTYRVHDWNRVNATGRARELHVAEALASIDFMDAEPEVLKARPTTAGEGTRLLVQDPLFRVDEQIWEKGVRSVMIQDKPVVAGIIKGAVVIEALGGNLELKAGGFCLLPACLGKVVLGCASPLRLLWATPG